LTLTLPADTVPLIQVAAGENAVLKFLFAARIRNRNAPDAYGRGSWPRVSNPGRDAKLTRQRPDGQLICVCSPPVPWRGLTSVIFGDRPQPTKLRWLRLMEERESAIMLALQASSLTPREDQVLYWISKGKRDEEIGLILGISKRTANHHSEAVLRKLGTETRGAAALVAFEAIQQRSVASRGQ
jgi:DNA-binding CsgD family transcriptional regulator